MPTNADILIYEMISSHPEKFESDKDYYMFELRYVALFDKNFHELKHLQETAPKVTGRQNEFKGYIVIDMNS